MKLTDFEAQLFTQVDVPVGVWGAARLVGLARTKMNASRSANHDRGTTGNANVDLWGAVTELILRRILQNVPDSNAEIKQIEDGLFVASSGALIKGADLQFEDNGKKIGIDAKSFNCEPGYEFFAIADSKHHALRGTCYGYFCIIVPRYGKRAVVAKLVPYTDVDQWECKPLRRNGNPSRNLPISAFVANYCSPFDWSALKLDSFGEKDVAKAGAAQSVKALLAQITPAISPFLP